MKDNKIDLPSASIELLTAFMVIHHFNDYEAMMNEICRVLKPGGYLFIREHNVSKKNNKLREYLIEIHKQWPNRDENEVYNFSERN